MRGTLALVAIAAFATSASAGPLSDEPPVQGRQQCFWASRITGFNDAGQDTVIVNISARQSWELALSPGCPDVNYALRIGIRSRGTERICSGRDAELIIPNESGNGARRCLIRSVRLLSPAERDALGPTRAKEK